MNQLLKKKLKEPFTYDIEKDINVEYTWIEGQGSGTENDPYTITSNEDFIRFIDLIKESNINTKNLKGIYFNLTTDLDFSNNDPIVLPNHDNYFYGYFDGKGHIIKNLNGNYNGTLAASLFSRVNGVVANVGLVGGSFTIKTGADMSAIIASRLEGTGVIYNTFSTTTLNFTTSNTNKKPAGLVAYSNYGQIINCYYDGTINSENATKIFGLTRFSSAKYVTIKNSFIGTNVNTDINYGTDSSNSSLDKLDITSDSTLLKLNNYQKSVSGEFLWKLSDDNTYLTFIIPDEEEITEPEEPPPTRGNRILKRYRNHNKSILNK